MHPKVKDIVFVATIKILLKPMVEAIPGFGECFLWLGPFSAAMLSQHAKSVGDSRNLFHKEQEHPMDGEHVKAYHITNLGMFYEHMLWWVFQLRFPRSHMWW